MSATIKDIASACKVSYSTVSRVLNGKFIRESDTILRIRETARSMGYLPNQAAVQLVKQESRLLGLIIPDIANPHYPEITKYVEERAIRPDTPCFCATAAGIPARRRHTGTFCWNAGFPG